MSKKEMTPLSASRIKTAQNCSWLYHCGYKLKLPQKGNTGSGQGWICHLVFECLGNPRHEHYRDKILETGDVRKVPAIHRMMRKHSGYLEVDEDSNYDEMNTMIINGLEYDFFGNMRQEGGGRPDESISERSFDIIEDREDGVRYRMRGFIDKLFFYDKDSLAIVRDFKSSKKTFEGKEKTNNLQDAMYGLAVKKLYPNVENIRSEFLFLKYDLNEGESQAMEDGGVTEVRDYENSCEGELISKEKNKKGQDPNGVIYMDHRSEDCTNGLEIFLTGVQEYIDNFDEKTAHSAFALNKGFPDDGSFTGKLLCAPFCKYKGQIKKDGSVMWHCPYRFSFNYFKIVDEEGKVVKTFFEEDAKDFKDYWSKLDQEKYSWSVEHYGGCPAWKK